MEMWSNGNETICLVWEKHNMWALEVKPPDKTLWVSGINLYWLLSNNFKRVR